jgi:hypothetical protein
MLHRDAVRRLMAALFGIPGLLAVAAGAIEPCGTAATPISNVQGPGAASPLAGATVEVEGIVTAAFQDTASELGGFFIHTPEGEEDADPATSEGLFVYDDGFGVAVAPGDRVRVAGTVAERFGQTALEDVTGVSVCSTATPITPPPLDLPEAARLGLERYEGMLVTFPAPLYVTGTVDLVRYGQVDLAAGGRLYRPTTVVEPGPPALDLQAENDLHRIILDDGSKEAYLDAAPFLRTGNTLRVGDTVTGLTGILEYNFGAYRIQPTGPAAFEPMNPRPMAPPDTGGQLVVAAMNVGNFFTTLDNGSNGARGADTALEFQRQRDKLVAALSAMEADVLGLAELENNGAGPGSALDSLVTGLNAVAGRDVYAAVDTGSLTGADPIAVGYIYHTGTVSPAGSPAVLDSTVDARYREPLNRPALAVTFHTAATGDAFTVALNHWKAKGFPCDSVGDPNRGDGQDECPGTRTDAARALVDWLATDPTDSGSDAFLILGDLNAYAMEDPIAVLEDAGYVHLLEPGAGTAPYSFNFNAESGLLDHALASPGLLPSVTGAGVWHINADEPDALDYNTEDHPPELFAAGPFRSSDHDPVLVGLTLEQRPPRHPADLNADDLVNAIDVQLVINAVLRIIVLPEADVNGDEFVNALDVQRVINAVLGLD